MTMIKKAIKLISETKENDNNSIKIEDLADLMKVTRQNLYYWFRSLDLPLSSGRTDITTAINFLNEYCEDGIIIKRDVSKRGRCSSPTQESSSM